MNINRLFNLLVNNSEEEIEFHLFQSGRLCFYIKSFSYLMIFLIIHVWMIKHMAISLLYFSRTGNSDLDRRYMTINIYLTKYTFIVSILHAMPYRLQNLSDNNVQ